MNVSKSASNAVKHGLTSRLFVPEHARALVEEIRQDLISIHQPESAEEKHLIGDLAVAHWQNSEHDRRFYERQAYEQSIAADIFDQQMQIKFQEQLAQLKLNPVITFRSFAGSYFGVLHMQTRFRDALASLSESRPLSFQQITDCINAIGEDWRLDSCSTEARKIMAWHLALVADPEEEIGRWVALSEPLSAAAADENARHYYASSPDSTTARNALIDRLTAELAGVNSRISKVKQEFENRRDLFTSANAGYGLDDPAVSKAAMLALRYRTTAFNRSNRLYKELDKLKADRRKMGISSIYSSYCRPAPVPVVRPAKQNSQPNIDFEFVNFSVASVQHETDPEHPQKSELRNEIRVDVAHVPLKPMAAMKIDKNCRSAKVATHESRQDRLVRLLN